MCSKGNVVYVVKISYLSSSLYIIYRIYVIFSIILYSFILDINTFTYIELYLIILKRSYQLNEIRMKVEYVVYRQHCLLI